MRVKQPRPKRVIPGSIPGLVITKKRGVPLRPMAKRSRRKRIAMYRAVEEWTMGVVGMRYHERHHRELVLLQYNDGREFVPVDHMQVRYQREEEIEEVVDVLLVPKTPPIHDV